MMTLKTIRISNQNMINLPNQNPNIDRNSRPKRIVLSVFFQLARSFEVLVFAGRARSLLLCLNQFPASVCVHCSLSQPQSSFSSSASSTHSPSSLTLSTLYTLAFPLPPLYPIPSIPNSPHSIHFPLTIL